MNELMSEPWVVALSTFAQHCFDGARPVQVEIVDGAIVAFNLIVQADVAAEVHVLHIGSQELALELDRLSAAHAHTASTASVAQIVYAVNGVVALIIADQPAIRLQVFEEYRFPNPVTLVYPALGPGNTLRRDIGEAPCQ